MNSKKKGNLRHVILEWLKDHSNITPGQYTLKYQSGKVKYNLEPNYGDKHHVTKHGRVYYLVSKKLNIWKESTYRVSLKYRSKNHYFINVRIQVKCKKESLSRMVAKVWIDNPNNKPLVMHLDNDRLNNDYLNLKWGTQKENIQQALHEGRLTTLFKSGINNPNCGKSFTKLSSKQELLLVSDLLSNKYTKTYLANKYGIARSTINNILKRRSYGNQ